MIAPKKRKVRWPLLVLLWAWAGCVFVVIDLFWTVPEFDRVRPRASLYRGMRVAAHRMVGERLPGESAMEPLPLGRPRQAVLSLDHPERLRKQLARIAIGEPATPELLLRARSRIPAALRGEYAVALATVAVRSPERREELAGIALLELCRGEIDWSAVAGVCGRLDRVVHGFETDPRHALAIARLRIAMKNDLSQERALASATLLATPEITARALALLDTLPLDEQPPRWLHAARTVLRHGDTHQRDALASWVAAASGRTDDANIRGSLSWVAREARRP